MSISLVPPASAPEVQKPLTTNYAPVHAPCEIGACLVLFVSRWEASESSPMVISLVSGVQLEFKATLSQACSAIARLSLQGSSTQMVSDFIKKRAIERLPAQVGFYVHIFLFPKKNRKMRPLFNMKPLNQSF